MNQRFHKADRVVRQSDFDRARASDYVASDHVLVIKGVPNGLNHSRLGLAVSRQVGNAVLRNRWKRILREAFRLQRDSIPAGWDFVVRPRRGACPKSGPAADSMVRLSLRIDKFARRRTRKAGDSPMRSNDE